MKIDPIKFLPTKGTVIVQMISKGQTRGGIFLPENVTENDEAVLAAAHASYKEISVGTKVLIRSNSTCQRLKLEKDSTCLVFDEKDILGAYVD
jgi:co-chaperonin GroES (HSP10)